jgi:hypothetical protein
MFPSSRGTSPELRSDLGGVLPTHRENVLGWRRTDVDPSCCDLAVRGHRRPKSWNAGGTLRPFNGRGGTSGCRRRPAPAPVKRAGAAPPTHPKREKRGPTERATRGAHTPAEEREERRGGGRTRSGAGGRGAVRGESYVTARFRPPAAGFQGRCAALTFPLDPVRVGIELPLLSFRDHASRKISLEGPISQGRARFRQD